MIADDAHNTTSAGLPAFARPLDEKHPRVDADSFLQHTEDRVKRSHKRGNEETIRSTR
ncbi:MAG: hypothetical protein Ct9H300mP15_29090 [Gemmatimonadota bacterium]|nr:MAG: hypothetical protein Ct9H300mP15_29090 [Gemmatimonadota bacterium]